MDAVAETSSKWKAAFNFGNATVCAAQYKPDAIMHARPFTTFTGTREISAFWQGLIDDGYADVDYVDPKLKVVDQSSVILTSLWHE